MTQLVPAVRPDTCVRRRAGVLYRELEGEAILLDPEAGTYFAINPVGTAVWEAIREPAILATVRDSVVARFEVTRETAWSDLARFIADLVKEGLAEVVNP